MSCFDAIVDAINALPDDEIFSTRSMLEYGYRDEVDRALFKLVRTKYIRRLAWGIFIKAGGREPSAFEVAQVKAEAFGKTLVTDGAELAGEMTRRKTSGKKIVFHSTGRTTSFRFGRKRIVLQGVCAKLTQGKETESAQCIRALLFIARKWGHLHMLKTTHTLNLEKVSKMLKSAAWMPKWLGDALRCRLEELLAPPLVPASSCETTSASPKWTYLTPSEGPPCRTPSTTTNAMV